MLYELNTRRMYTSASVALIGVSIVAAYCYSNWTVLKYYSVVCSTVTKVLGRSTALVSLVTYDELRFGVYADSQWHWYLMPSEISKVPASIPVWTAVAIDQKVTIPQRSIFAITRFRTVSGLFFPSQHAPLVYLAQPSKTVRAAAVDSLMDELALSTFQRDREALETIRTHNKDDMDVSMTGIAINIVAVLSIINICVNWRFLVMFVASVGGIRIRRRRQRGLCVRCGYPATSGELDVCPECGIPMLFQHGGVD